MSSLLMLGPNSKIVLQPTIQMTLRYKECPDMTFIQQLSLQKQAYKDKMVKTLSRI